MANENHTDVNALWPGDGFGAKMNDKPLVSVIIPVFNLESYLGEAVDSVLNQTCQDFEIILVDDGSTDRSQEIINGYQRRLPEKVRAVFQNHRGAAAARNTGIAMAGGEWIAFLDGDDLWRPKKLELQLVMAAADPDCNFVATTTEILDRNCILQIFPPPPFDLKLELLLRGCFITLSTVLIRCELLSKTRFDERLEGAHDLDLYLRLADSIRLQIVPSTQVLYRIRADSISGAYNSHYLQALRHFQTARREVSRLKQETPQRFNDNQLQLERMLSWLAHEVTYRALMNPQVSPLKRLQLSLIAISHRPRYGKNYRLLMQSFLPASLNRRISQARHRDKSAVKGVG